MIPISDKNSKINIIKSARNIPSIKIIEPAGVNVYDLLKYKNGLVITILLFLLVVFFLK